MDGNGGVAGIGGGSSKDTGVDVDCMDSSGGGEDGDVFYDCIPPSWFRRNRRMKQRRQRRRLVQKLHRFGGGLAAAQCGHSSMHEFKACSDASFRTSVGDEASGSSSAPSQGVNACNSHADGSGSAQRFGWFWKWVMFILAMIVVPIAYIGACGAAVGVASQRVFHSICVCTGLQSSDCLHLYCSLLGHDTAALLDSGASHCFVDKEWLTAKSIKGLQPVRFKEPTSFRQANGSQVECAYVYPCLKLKLGRKVV